MALLSSLNNKHMKNSLVQFLIEVAFKEGLFYLLLAYSQWTVLTLSVFDLLLKEGYHPSGLQLSSCVGSWMSSPTCWSQSTRHVISPTWVASSWRQESPVWARIFKPITWASWCVPLCEGNAETCEILECISSLRSSIYCMKLQIR